MILSYHNVLTLFVMILCVCIQYSTELNTFKEDIFMYGREDMIIMSLWSLKNVQRNDFVANILTTIIWGSEYLSLAEKENIDTKNMTIY